MLHDDFHYALTSYLPCSRYSYYVGLMLHVIWVMSFLMKIRHSPTLTLAFDNNNVVNMIRPMNWLPNRHTMHRGWHSITLQSVLWWWCLQLTPICYTLWTTVKWNSIQLQFLYKVNIWILVLIWMSSISITLSFILQLDSLLQKLMTNM